MPLAWLKLEQRGRRTFASLPAFLTNQPARKIVDECSRYVTKHDEINIAPGLAS
jgi:hypothetical protein